MKTPPLLTIRRILAGLLPLAALATPTQAVDFHVTTAQELQNALTLAAANGADDTIYLAAGYYTGNFNFNSAEARSLVLQGEAGTTNTQITVDGAGTGRDMNLANTGNGNFTVRGITFLRNCGSTSIGALRIAGGTGSSLLVDSCRFLSPTNASANGIGLEIVSCQNATLTNCVAVGNARNGNGLGIQIMGVSGTVTVGGCQVSTNNGASLSIGGTPRPGTVNIVGNNFDGNTGAIDVNGVVNTFLNNSVVGNRVGVSFWSCPIVSIVGNVFRANGYAGSACQVSGASSLLLSNNLFTANSRSANVSATATEIIGNTFLNNVIVSTGYGDDFVAGLYCSSSGAIIKGNTFTGNLGTGPGTGRGALWSAAPATIISNIFTGNAGARSGGLESSGATTLTDNIFTGNSGGGALMSSASGTTTISRNVFKQNSGGGLSVSAPTVVLTDNLVVKNTQGPGIGAYPTIKLTMINNTISDNTTPGSGGGLACSISGVTEVLDVYNNIIWGNSASGNGADIYLAGTGSRKTFLNNDVHGMYGVWDIADNLLDVAPVFFDPVNGDYHLRSTSPCINAGTNGAPSIPASDLDGNARTNAAIVDLGAYEFNNTTFHPADANQNWVIDAGEYAAYAAGWKNNQTWPTTPASIPADYVTRAGFIENQGGTYHNDGAGAPLGWKPGSN